MKHPVSSRQKLRVYQANPRAAETDVAAVASHVGISDRVDGPKDRPSISPSERRKYLRLYVRWLWPYRWALAGLFAMAMITAALDMVWPLAIRGVINNLSPAGPGAGAAPLSFGTAALGRSTAERLRALNILGGAVLALLLFKQFIESTRSYRSAVLNAKIIFRLRKRLFDALLNLSLGDLAEMKSGGIVSRLSSDIDAVSGLVQMAVISPGIAVIRVVLTAGILITLSWRLALAALFVIPPMAIFSLLWLKRVRPIYRSTHADRANVDARVNETFGGIRVVRAFRREMREERGYAISHHLIIRKRMWAERIELVLESGWGILLPATSLLIVWVGGYLSLHGRLDVGTIFAFLLYSGLLLQPVWAIVSSISTTQKSLAAMERVFEAINMPRDKPDRPDAIDAPSVVREVKFDHVSFEYRPGTPVLDDFTLTAPGGAVVALVGPSGAGKTTLTDLIARFHDPTAGAIYLNGLDLRRFRLASYRSLLAVVQQETFLFDGTVAENIAYGLRRATPAEIEDAARRANAHEFIDCLPEGYDTLIGERGFKLSGGQRQRLSIARAILANPAILILDEATSNLDTESEQLIQAALADLLQSRTTFVIAHRLSTITHADLIVAMDSGRIIETGTHEELMSHHGFYFRMVERQRHAMAESVSQPAHG